MQTFLYGIRKWYKILLAFVNFTAPSHNNMQHIVYFNYMMKQIITIKSSHLSTDHLNISFFSAQVKKFHSSYPLFSTPQSRRNHGAHPSMDQSFFSCSKYPDWWLWDPARFLFNRKQEPFPQGQSSCVINLTIHLHLERRLKMHGANHYSSVCLDSAVLKGKFIKKFLLLV
jgi:hypothetical protein